MMEFDTLTTFIKGQIVEFDLGCSNLLQRFVLGSIGYPIYYALGLSGEPLLFYLPAEYENLSDIECLVEGMRCRGFHCVCLNYNDLLVNHRGTYDIFELVRGIFKEFTLSIDKKTYEYTHVVVMGRSVGGSFALDLCSNFSDKVTALILESVFLRFDEFLRRQGIEFSGGDITGNVDKMRNFKKPTLFLHSSRDELVSLTEIEWLVCESRSKGTQFQVMPAPTRRDFQRVFGEMYFDFLRDFIWQKIGRKPFRRKRT